MSARAQRLAELLPGVGIDVLIVSGLPNIRYLSGYTGSNGLLLIGERAREFLTDFRYVVQAEAEVGDGFARHTASVDLLEAVLELLPADAKRIGFEEEHLSVRQHRGLAERLGDRAELIGVSGLVEGLRTVKDDEEIEHIAEAAELADAALRRVIGEGLGGRTERDVAIALEQDMRRRGATRPSFPTIVAAGAHAALPHASPRDVEIRAGDLVVVDWGAELDGYCSDCTRTFSVGEPSAEARRIYDLVLEAQLAGLHAIRPDIDGREVDAVARSVVEAGGHGQHFGHGLGHGVGIETHEAPRLSKRSVDRLASGNVVTVEPGIYLPGKLGVRIEDLVAVGPAGPRVLTSLSKELTVVD